MRGVGDVSRLPDTIVPSLTLYEVFKRILQQSDEGRALEAVAVMQQSTVIDLDARIALDAARISWRSKIPMADSIILATARTYGATVWTQDADFRHIPDAKYRGKKP